jgi:drug/metabolite transporter (DMT)-like permease
VITAAPADYDESLLMEMVTKIGGDFAFAGQASIRGYISDARVSPMLLTMAVVRAHMLGAASMLAAQTEGADTAEVVTWLIEAFVEARAAVGSIVPESAQ